MSELSELPVPAPGEVAEKLQGEGRLLSLQHL